MAENQHHLYIACETSHFNFVVPNFWFFIFIFSKLFREINSFILTGEIYQFLGI